MFRSKKIWWTAAALLIILHIPFKGYVSARQDEYARTTLLGKITLEYDYRKRGTDANHTSTFSQRYSLDATGNILNKLLIIYDAGLEYTRESTGYASQVSSSDYHAYYFRSTILPQSNIPLTLHGRRAVIGNSVSNSYGLSWLGKFRRLPRTAVRVNRADTKGPDSKSRHTDYGLTLQKNTRRTRNNFNTSLTQRENLKTSKKSTNSAINFVNKIRISRNTHVDISAARGVSKGDDSTKMTVEGLQASISSKPVEGFNQGHRYSYFETRSGSDVNNSESYSGNIGYKFSDRLTSNMALSVSRDDTDSSTTQRETNNMVTSGSLSYRVSSKLSVSERVRYRKADGRASAAGESNLADLTSLSVSTNASYGTRLSWAFMASSYGVGYSEESSTSSKGDGETEGRGLSQSAALAFAGIDAMGYASVKTSGKYANATAFEGTLSRESNSFNLSADNKVWRRYVRLSGSYNRSESKSHIAAQNEVKSSLRFNGNTLYLTKYLNKKGNGSTSLSASFNLNSTDNEISSITTSRTSTTKNANLQHNRVFYRGLLNVSLTLTDTQSKAADSKASNTQRKLKADYTRALLRRVGWKSSLIHTNVTSNAATSTSSSITNTFKYRLRRWSMSADHQYSVHRSSNTKNTQHRLLLRLSRIFFRVL